MRTVPRPTLLAKAVDELLLQDASNLYKPLLGICYGFQSLNVWRGGTLVQHLKTHGESPAGRAVAEAHTHRAGRALAAEADSGSRLPLPPDGQQQPPSGPSAFSATALVKAAWSPDDGIVEAAEVHGDQFLMGVQWHPERLLEESKAAQCLFQSFVDAAAAWEPRMIRESVAD
jgi:putative glutamine amidotransferase